jgi:hypothetical protein
VALAAGLFCVDDGIGVAGRVICLSGGHAVLITIAADNLSNSPKFPEFGLEMCVDFAFFMESGDGVGWFLANCSGTVSG